MSFLNTIINFWVPKQELKLCTNCKYYIKPSSPSSYIHNHSCARLKENAPVNVVTGEAQWQMLECQDERDNTKSKRKKCGIKGRFYKDGRQYS